MINESCVTRSINIPSISSGELIKDCPEELIIDSMPTAVKSNHSNQYYIYKGIRREVLEFDSAWVSKNCSSMKITRVY
jgi:hypothetical protein